MANPKSELNELQQKLAGIEANGSQPGAPNTYVRIAPPVGESSVGVVHSRVFFITRKGGPVQHVDGQAYSQRDAELCAARRALQVCRDAASDDTPAMALQSGRYLTGSPAVVISAKSRPQALLCASPHTASAAAAAAAPTSALSSEAAPVDAAAQAFRVLTSAPGRVHTAQRKAICPAGRLFEDLQKNHATAAACAGEKHWLSPRYVIERPCKGIRSEFVVTVVYLTAPAAGASGAVCKTTTAQAASQSYAMELAAECALYCNCSTADGPSDKK
jgi:hypothetical protein